MKRAVMVVLLSGLVACAKSDGNRTPGAGDGNRETGMEVGSQRELAREIAAAERLRRDEAEARYRAIRDRWLGARVVWTLDLLPALCRTAGACHALPFDRLGADRAIVQGWLPRLRLDPATFSALQARCAGHPRCPITVSATLAELTLSAEEPTSLTLADVVVSPRPAARERRPAGERSRQAM